MFPAFDVATVRTAEEQLLAAQDSEDQLMQLAASAVADVAAIMLAEYAHSLADGDVLILVGPGGNGGDGLYAGASLALRGLEVSALIVGDDGAAHERALATFRTAGGTVLDADCNPRQEAFEHTLIVDAIAGLASARGLNAKARDVMDVVRFAHRPVLAVDMPTGVDATTGECAENHVVADVTVTFGGLKPGHLVAPECGEILIADLRLPGSEESFLQKLTAEEFHSLVGHYSHLPTVDAPYDWSNLTSGRSGATELPVWFQFTRETYTTIHGVEPGIRDDKYTGGVVTIAAGSKAYPGAGVLAVAGAVRATCAMVRAITDRSEDIIARFPEVVLSPSLTDAGRTQAICLGSGRGTDDAAREELNFALSQPVPLVLDADALTLLSEDSTLRKALSERGTPAVITPHTGEFERLYTAVFGNTDGTALLERVRRLAAELQVTVLLKGRITIICGPDGYVTTHNAGNSFAATPGSGDVLAGLVGAFVAKLHADDLTRAAGYSLSLDRDYSPTFEDLEHARLAAVTAATFEAVHVHAQAAALAANTPDGQGPVSALGIAEALPRAIARINTQVRTARHRHGFPPHHQQNQVSHDHE